MIRYNGTDIFGEPLQLGHCEVHPWINFEFPCPQCRNEDDDRKAQEEAYRKHMEQLSDQEES